MSDTPDGVVTTPPTDVEIGIASIAYPAKSTFDAFFGIVWSEDWKQFEVSEQVLFRDLIEQYFAQASVIREKFDADVWKGHSNGTVDPSVTSVRKQREGDTPGKKAEKPTADSVLAKRLKK